MHRTKRWIGLAAAMAFWDGGPGSPALAGEEVTEVERSLSDLPEAAASALKKAAKEAPKEVEEIRYEGITVLYEAEYIQNGEEYEVYVYPNGELAERHEHDKGKEKEVKAN